jgi:hypothetical protein
MAIHVWHHDIEQNQVGGIVLAQLERLLAIGRHKNIMVFGKNMMQYLDIERLIIDHQQSGSPGGTGIKVIHHHIRQKIKQATVRKAKCCGMPRPNLSFRFRFEIYTKSAFISIIPRVTHLAI